MRPRGREALARTARTFATLVSKPGLLTLDHAHGRRARYLRPLQLFLWCNVLFFFLQPYTGFNVLSTPLSMHMERLPYSRLAADMVTAAVAARGASWTEYRLVFDITSDHLSRTLVVLMVPLFAGATYLLYRRPRLPYGEHVVFALHVYAFVLLVSPLLLPLVIALARGAVATGLPRADATLFAETAPAIAWAAYVMLAAQRVWPASRLVGLVRALAATAALVAILQIYRFALFLITFYAV